MTTPLEHYETAQELLAAAEQCRMEAYAAFGPGDDRNRLMRKHGSLVQEATAHALVAQVAVTALGNNGGLPFDDYEAWETAASVQYASADNDARPENGA